jgi:uncharacterized membrane protein
MKRSLMIVMALALTVAVGCSLSNRGGGVSTDEGFRIAVPILGTQVKQGEIQTVAVTVHRGENFKRDVKLQIKASKGISVEPTSVWVKASDKPEVQLQVSAARNAALGEYRVYVEGTPASGQSSSVDFKVKVVAP